jgi:uncharacterized protein YdhG (YjbR/CyaY superfamily)
VDEYLAKQPEGPRAALQALRAQIKIAAPGATETIAYDMPAFRLNGRFLVSYAGYKSHCSLFPATDRMLEELGDELKPYFSGKGTLRFKADKPIPPALVKKIVRIAVREVAARGNKAPA